MASGLLALVAALIFVLAGLRVVPEDQRLAIIRLGRYAGIRGPGLVFVVPVVDPARRVVLDADVPGWRLLSSESLSAAIQQKLQI